MVFCLISPHVPSPTRKWKTRPYGTCFLSSDGFVYTLPCLPHLHNPKNPVQMAGFRVFCLIPPISPPSPENGKHSRMRRVFWLRVSSFTFPHTYPTYATQETRSEMTGFGFIASSPPISPPPPENGKHVCMGRVFWLRVTSFTFPHAYPTYRTQKTLSKWLGLWCSFSYPSYPLPHPKMENMLIWDMFSGFR